MHADLYFVPRLFEYDDFNAVWMIGMSDGLLDVLPLCKIFNANNSLNYPIESRLSFPNLFEAYDEMIRDTNITAARQFRGISCTAWSDMFYIPRSTFLQFRIISEILVKHLVMVDEGVAISLMLLVAQNPGLNSQLIKCGGGCCGSPPLHDILKTRCGHKISFGDANIWKAHFDRL
jgi:hypothetical protein